MYGYGWMDTSMDTLELLHYKGGSTHNIHTTLTLIIMITYTVHVAMDNIVLYVESNYILFAVFYHYFVVTTVRHVLKV